MSRHGGTGPMWLVWVGLASAALPRRECPRDTGRHGRTDVIMVRHVVAGWARRGANGVGHGQAVMICRVRATARRGRPGLARHGRARLGRRGVARRVASWSGRRGTMRYGRARRGRLGQARRCLARLGRQGQARLGEAWPSRSGKARPGRVRPGRRGEKNANVPAIRDGAAKVRRGG
jgi:hypothetical protein